MKKKFQQISKKNLWFYAQYLREETTYDQDIKQYSELEDFRRRLDQARKKYDYYARSNPDGANAASKLIGYEEHPYFQDKTLPTEYATALQRARQRETTRQLAFEKNGSLKESVGKKGSKSA